jgi:hypothetical protein
MQDNSTQSVTLCQVNNRVDGSFFLTIRSLTAPGEAEQLGAAFTHITGMLA